ncbi:flagellar hook-basal body protein [Desulfuribacillus alkaliarsenatis]|uniref:Uncharacterized protein n=1 Tax=Desulfuribacillus alkaliarsenatis TaxID=766136 RepID=A0A1E5G1M3_9FIRM|nr:flagellar hook-basal body complex protein [Desulfuribacillus alkaliarsenatis]OEF96795.1 hypothetical protein BHF68_06950 [Desulfuribacillus alkaliarsenatis]
MLRGLYTAAQGMKVNQQRHDIANNNLANINTPGFKGEEAVVRSFPEELLFFMGKKQHSHVPAHSRVASHLGGQPPRVGYLHQGVTVEEIVSRFAQGAIRETGNEFNVAIIDGLDDQKGFFAVKKDLDSDDVFYTRAGDFRLREVDGVQYLATQDGEFVMQRELIAGVGFTGQLMPVEIIEEDFVIHSNGSIEVFETGFPPIQGELHLVQFANEQLPGLTKEGHGLFRINEDFLGAGFEPEIAQNIQTRQKFIEGSNVDPTQAIMDMIIAQRAYEANQRVIQSYDRSLEKAVNEVGRV